jgi:glycosyltransferase involved in cell wall biosynthesis
MTKVEALVPAWQSADFIQPTLDSLSAQTHPEFSVRISVDRCDDDTFTICERHAKADPRFHVVRQQERHGYVGNCNFLLGEASADHVLFAFHDDILAPTYVEKLSAALDRRPDAVLSFSDLEVNHVNGVRETCDFTELDGLPSRVERGYRMLMSQGNWWAPNRGVFRLVPARAIGGLKLHGAGEFSADRPWLFRLSLLGEFVRVPETLCFKYYKPGSLSLGWEFSPQQGFELGASLLRELWNSELTAAEKLALAGPQTKRMIAQARLLEDQAEPAFSRLGLRRKAWRSWLRRGRPSGAARTSA